MVANVARGGVPSMSNAAYGKPIEILLVEDWDQLRGLLRSYGDFWLTIGKLPGWGWTAGKLPGPLRGRGRQGEEKAAAPVRLGFDPDLAAMMFDNFLAGSQADAMPRILL